MTEANEPQTRYRVNVKTGAKGQKTYDCTVESTELTREQVIAESDALVAALDERYPAPID